MNKMKSSETTLKELTGPETDSAAREDSSGCNYTYILRCGDGSLYTGWTNNLEKRVEAHQSGKGAKYTRSHQPVELVYAEIFETQSEAMRREREIKRLTRAKKEQLIQESITSQEI